MQIILDKKCMTAITTSTILLRRIKEFDRQFALYATKVRMFFCGHRAYYLFKRVVDWIRCQHIQVDLERLRLKQEKDGKNMVN